MPRLDKGCISGYLRSECERRLRQDLSPDTDAYRPERTAAGMPPPDVLPGLDALRQAGEEWEAAKLSDLSNALGRDALIGDSHVNRKRATIFGAIQLAQRLGNAQTGQFLVQATYEVTDEFKNAMGITAYAARHGLAFSQLRPDLIEVLPAHGAGLQINSNGDILPVAAGDARLPLRVIDIKLTADPSVSYFTEITYYSMVLAGWLADNGFSDRFFVVPDAALWPGSHGASNLWIFWQESQRQGIARTRAEMVAELRKDLEPLVFQAFAPRIKRFFEEELPRVLDTPWRQLQWHVDNRCIGCEYLGQPRRGLDPNAEYCWEAARASDHLSRIAFVSRGARIALEESNLSTVAALAQVQANHPAFDGHHTLRATRTVVAGRAHSLGTTVPAVPAQAGTSAVLPRWADLSIYVSADFDAGSGITTAFGLSAVYAAAHPNFHRWPATAFPVEDRDVQVELRELLRFLDQIVAIKDQALQRNPGATIQVYVWDTVTYDHLVRVIGRHLVAVSARRDLARLIWLFPPEAIVANPDLSDRKNPVAIVRNAVRALVAAPVPHYYSLLGLARQYHDAATQAPHNQFIVPVLFEDRLSDQIPSARAHDIWSRTNSRGGWNLQFQELQSTVKTKLRALESVRRRLAEDLGVQLGQTAPRIRDLGRPSYPRNFADDSRLWLTFQLLDSALQALDVQTIWAMPVHEREARFKSAVLPQRIQGAREQAILAAHNLPASPLIRVYELAQGSREVRARDGDLGFAIAPRGNPGFLGLRLNRVAGNVAVQLPGNANPYTTMEYVTRVTVKAINRDQRYVVVELQGRWQGVIAQLEAAGAVDLSADLVMDPVHLDFLTRRVRDTLEAIGNPPNAVPAPGVQQALGGPQRTGRTAAVPCADFFWNAQAMHAAQVPRVLQRVRDLLDQNGRSLNASQWAAWQQALTHRLRLIWGPPGTGKSHTLRAIILGALHEASLQGRAQRILVTAQTYEAIDQVMTQLQQDLSGGTALALPNASIARLRSALRQAPTGTVAAVDVPASLGDPGYAAVLARLAANNALTLVGATPQQVNKLLEDSGGLTNGLFDLIIVDEASQLDVATSTLALSGLAPGGSVVIAGDPKQLPPIRKAEAPLGLEYMVGPIFEYFTGRFGVQPEVLEENYRSCQQVVELAHEAAYPRTLTAYSPGLRINLVSPIPADAQPPAGWNAGLWWSPEWAALLDPEVPVCCFVYPEGRSSQWNHFEADSVACLVSLLAGRLGGLRNERVPPAGNVRAPGNAPYPMAEFWERGVGIVTPHRAQQALVIGRLQSLFPGNNGAGIREAVDTVERFQGQQRDVMLATFSLGDPDAIADEAEFLLSLNRFNVMSSRARGKLIVFVSQELVDYLSADEEILKGSALLKTFVHVYCQRGRRMTLSFLANQQPQARHGKFRWRA